MRQIYSIALLLIISIIMYQPRANATPPGHARALLFESVEFDTIPQDIVAGQKVSISFKIILRDDFRSQIQGTFDLIDSATVDSQPILLTIRAGSYTNRVSLIELEESLLKDIVPETTFQHAVGFIPSDIGVGYINFNTNLGDIFAGKTYKFLLTNPASGEYVIYVRARYAVPHEYYNWNGVDGFNLVRWYENIYIEKDAQMEFRVSENEALAE